MLAASFQVRGNLEDAAPERAWILEQVAGADAIVATPAERMDESVMDAAGPGLRVISNFAVGYDNVDVEAASARGIVVTNTPGVLTEATADLTWALILAAARRVVEGDHLVRSGRFRGLSPFLLLGHDLASRTLGIVGMGRIGQAVAKRAAGFQMRVVYTRPSGPLPPALPPPGSDWQYRPKLRQLFQEADVVSLHVPLSPETRHLVGARELELLRPHAILVNTSRGPVLDEKALSDALRRGKLWCAALDVYEEEPVVSSELLLLPNVVLLPHLGSATVETRRRMAEMTAANAIAAIKGERPPHAVNPEAMALRSPRSGREGLL
jgi:glyoxylate reductase